MPSEGVSLRWLCLNEPLTAGIALAQVILAVWKTACCRSLLPARSTPVQRLRRDCVWRRAGQARSGLQPARVEVSVEVRAERHAQCCGKLRRAFHADSDCSIALFASALVCRAHREACQVLEQVAAQRQRQGGRGRGVEGDPWLTGGGRVCM